MGKRVRQEPGDLQGSHLLREVVKQCRGTLEMTVFEDKPQGQEET